MYADLQANTQELGHIIAIVLFCFVFWDTYFQSVSTNIRSHEQCPPHSYQHLSLMIDILTGIKWNLKCILIGIFLIVKDNKYFLLCLFELNLWKLFNLSIIYLLDCLDNILVLYIFWVLIFYQLCDWSAVFHILYVDFVFPMVNVVMSHRSFIIWCNSI